MYYVLQRFWADFPGRWIGQIPHVSGVYWNLGRVHDQPIPSPLEFTLQPFDPGTSDMGPSLPEYYKGPIPLFRDDLLAALLEAGVDNLDMYEAVILDPDTGEKHHNYKAVNIVGVVSAVDMARSNTTVNPGGPLIDVDLDGFTVDDTRPAGLLVFRLAEKLSGIMVHESVVKHLRRRGFNALEFMATEDVAL